MELFTSTININQLLYLATLVTFVAVFYFKSDKALAVKLAIHEREIAALYKLLNSFTHDLREISKDLKDISVELAEKTGINPQKPRRKI